MRPTRCTRAAPHGAAVLLVSKDLPPPAHVFATGLNKCCACGFVRLFFLSQGVRAMLIDKTKDAKWSPAALKDVSATVRTDGSMADNMNQSQAACSVMRVCACVVCSLTLTRSCPTTCATLRCRRSPRTWSRFQRRRSCSCPGRTGGSRRGCKQLEGVNSPRRHPLAGSCQRSCCLVLDDARGRNECAKSGSSRITLAALMRWHVWRRRDFPVTVTAVAVTGGGAGECPVLCCPRGRCPAVASLPLRHKRLVHSGIV